MESAFALLGFISLSELKVRQQPSGAHKLIAAAAMQQGIINADTPLLQDLFYGALTDKCDERR